MKQKQLDIRSDWILAFKSFFKPISYGKDVLSQQKMCEHITFLNVVIGLMIGSFFGTLAILNQEILTGIILIISIPIVYLIYVGLTGLFGGLISHITFIIFKSKIKLKETLKNFYVIYSILFAMALLLPLPLILLGSMSLFLSKIFAAIIFGIAFVSMILIFIYTYIYVPLLVHKTYKLTIGEAFLAGLLYYGISQIVGLILMIVIYLIAIIFMLIFGISTGNLF